MRRVIVAGCAVAAIGAVVGFLSGLGGLFGGPVDGLLILGALGFVCGSVSKARGRRSQ